MQKQTEQLNVKGLEFHFKQLALLVLLNIGENLVKFIYSQNELI